MSTAPAATTEAPTITQTVAVEFVRCGNCIAAWSVEFTAVSDTDLVAQIGAWVARQIDGATVTVDFEVGEGRITGAGGCDEGWFAIMGEPDNDNEEGWR